ncbi:DUF2407 C-terminal domain-containing protein [Amylocarpus encephaloides]|uniref:DUF2407 C-terminal domain-containing protein n=1 Tax=Amylocarpus encephaloides TaxID=45428 RepID=A0A9P7YEI7_9HELO|nr:DUF2407 C-terminal domain-containing protein [Amylocarpus encephaloides]
MSTTPLRLTIRFTTSIPDLLLDVDEPDATSVVALKHQIRSRLESPTSNHRFRFIYSGRLLKDDDILSGVLKIPEAPPRASDLKGKGKAIDLPPPRVYINCSIGDVLATAELAAESAAATKSSLESKSGTKHGSKNASPTRPAVSTAPATQGFDRLLSGGFTPAEVNQLRLQFLSIQANIHTPDTMPSPSTLRRMEDAWIDDNAGNAGVVGATAGGFDFGDDGLGGGALDDLLWGNVMGFLWPLGCVGWIIHEDGVWSARRKMAVFTGFMLSLTFGILRVMS